MFPRKYRIHAALILLFLAIIIVPQYTNKPDKHAVQAADAAAREFLKMVDEAKYADSWLIIDSYLKEKVSQSEWQQKLEKMHQGLGPATKRTLENASFTAAIKELPNRKLMLLEYSTTFKSKKVQENVTVIQKKDSTWRVIGYFIK